MARPFQNQLRLGHGQSGKRPRTQIFKVCFIYILVCYTCYMTIYIRRNVLLQIVCSVSKQQIDIFHFRPLDFSQTDDDVDFSLCCSEHILPRDNKYLSHLVFNFDAPSNLK